MSEPHWDQPPLEPEDPLAAVRGIFNGCAFMAGVYLLAGVVIAVLLLW